ncbi:MAG: esterase family protein [Deltaproteobacteria bacterium]|nr:esterase family protein [Deltaproteobacteria bacterium]
MLRSTLALAAILTACSTPAAPNAAAPAIAAATTPPLPAVHGPGRVENVRFHSDALGVDKHYVIYLPGGYGADPDARWPVVYYLHGLGGSETDWTAALDIETVADRLALPAILVMPDGDTSFYANGVTPPDYDACMRDGAGLFDPRADRAATCARTAQYEDYMVHDLIDQIDRTYATRRDRAGRGIAGLSMGGYGALMLAMRHPDLFSAAASHSGVDALLYLGPHPYAPGDVQLVESPALLGRLAGPIGALWLSIYGADRTRWEAYDPAFLAQKLAPGALALYLDCGTEDGFQLNDGASYLHDLLTARGIAHTFFLGPGGHDLAFWRDRLDDSLAFFAAHFAAR